MSSTGLKAAACAASSPKLLSDPIANDPMARDQFQREAEAVSALNHPGICAICDVGFSHTPRTGASGIGTGWETPSIAGIRAGRYLAREPPLTLEARYIGGALGAVATCDGYFFMILSTASDTLPRSGLFGW